MAEVDSYLRNIWSDFLEYLMMMMMMTIMMMMMMRMMIVISHHQRQTELEYALYNNSTLILSF